MNEKLYYTTEWNSATNYYPDYFTEEEEVDSTEARRYTWMVFDKEEDAAVRLKKCEEDHPNLPHRAVLVLKSEWLNDELNEL